MKILCVFGKYQYGDPSRGIGTEYAAFLPALKLLGYDVVHFDSWDRSRYKDFKELNHALLDKVDAERPDVLLSVQMHYEIWLETLQMFKERGDVATICWTTDDSWKYKEFSRFVGKSYHAMTTTYSDVVKKYHSDGIPNVILTQWGANIDSLQEPLPANKCRYQISFVGAAHGDRKKKMSELRSKGIDVTCFGHGWPAGSVSSFEIANIMRDSVISINFSNSRGRNQIKARNFEVPGFGGFLLTEKVVGLEHYFVDGREIVVFENIDDLAEKARYYLAHPEQRDAIAVAGYERTRRDHTYDVRMKEIINFALFSKLNSQKKNFKNNTDYFDNVYKRHRITLPLRILKSLIVWPSTLIWGSKRGPRAARRVLFEWSWRIFGKKTYTSSGWPGRIFYKES